MYGRSLLFSFLAASTFPFPYPIPVLGLVCYVLLGDLSGEKKKKNLTYLFFNSVALQGVNNNNNLRMLLPPPKTFFLTSIYFKEQKQRKAS